MLPLVADSGVAIRDGAVHLQSATGDRIESISVWIHTPQRWSPEHWTSDPRRLAAERSDGQSGPGLHYLLARMPPGIEGDLKLGQQTLRPVWRDLPRHRDVDHDVELAFTQSPARPDPSNPFEYWRWVLLAERIGVAPPDPAHFGEVGQLIAEHFAGLWTIGVARLAKESPGVAGQVRDVLTRISLDDGHAFAAWPAEPEDLNRLLAELVNFHRPDAAVVSEALAWADGHDRPILWLESQTAEAVVAAMVNPSDAPIIARLAWIASDEVPLAVELPPGRLTRVRIERPLHGSSHVSSRPTVPGQAVAQPVTDVLRVQGERWQEDLPCGLRSIVIKPPGMLLPPLQPDLTLARLQMNQRGNTPADYATLVQVRKLAGRWEVFFECLRPGGRPAGNDRGTMGEQTRGREGVTVFVGENQDDGVALFIPELGEAQQLRGQRSADLEIHRRSYEDRWYCRVVLPDAWLTALLDDDTTPIGFSRTHRGSPLMQSAPHPPPPWRTDPGRISVNLTQWSDFPDSER